MKKTLMALLLAASLWLPTMALAGPNADLREGMYRGHSAQVEKALLQGADPNQMIRYGQYQISVLSWACNWGNLNLVKLLLSKGADVNPKDKTGLVPLKWAVAFGNNLELVKLLVEKGADVRYQDKEGFSILMSAAMGGNLPIVQYLVEKGTDIHAENHHGYTALMAAANYGHLPVLEYLVEKGADLADLDKEYRSVLSEAVAGNRMAVVLFYLEHVDKAANHGRDPMVQAQGYAEYYGKNDMLKQLRTLAQHQALLSAITAGKATDVGLLLESGVDPNAKNRQGKTALILAVYKGKTETVKYLLEKGADITATVGEGRTVLIEAAARGNLEIIKLLLEKGADPKVKNQAGKMAVDYAREAGHTDVVAYLEKWVKLPVQH